jgi:hypothetical protein
MDAEVARVICKEYRISCAEIILREDITVDQVRYRVNASTIQSQQWLQALDELLLIFSFALQLIDVIEGDRAYIPGELGTVVGHCCVRAKLRLAHCVLLL